MELIITGVFGFLFLMLSDYCQMKKKCHSTRLFAIIGVTLILVSSTIIILVGATFEVSLLVRIVFGLITIFFLVLMMYSILFEVHKNKHKEDTLVTTGTYALSRHPGVIWFLLYYVFGSIAFGNLDILIAGIIWSCANVVYVYLQEKLVFYIIFESYADYVKTTPMLFPNMKSIKRFFKTLDGGQNERFTTDV